MAGFAGLRGLELAQLLAHPGAFGLQHPAVEIADHAFERLLDRVALLAVGEGQRNRAAGGAVEDHDPHLDRQILPRRFEAEAEFLGQAGEHLHVIGRRRVALGPGHHRPLLEAERLVRHHQLRIEQQLFAQPIAGRAGAHRGVEAEQPRFEAFDREAGDRAGELFGKDDAVGGEAGALETRSLRAGFDRLSLSGVCGWFKLKSRSC